MMKSLIATLLATVLVLPAWGHPGHEHAQPSSEQSNAETSPRKRENPGHEKQPHAQPEDYKPVEVLGWTLRVNKDLLADKELYKKVHDEIHHQLFRITRVVPEERVKVLQSVTIWVELDNPYTNSCQYHASARWLEANGYLTEKAKCVDLGNAKRFLHESKTRQPFLLLHELTHAYHDQQLGYGDADILKCYKDAKEAGIYEEVLFSNGRKVRAYAMSNQMEYFAECTEAFFGQNDFYPFVRAELKVHDPAMYELLREIWGVK